MHRTLTGRLAYGAVIALVVMLSGCSSPLWRFDRYTVEGAFTDSTCTFTVDGRPVRRDALLPETPVQVMRDASYDAALPPGQGETVLRCLGMVFLIVSPQGTLPAPGKYRIVNASLSTEPGTAIMNLYESGVGSGPWLGALTGVHLEAKEGVLQLGAMTDSTARGTFRVIARRQPNGE